MGRFDEDRYYITTDPELKLLGSPYALAKQRSRGEGPRYYKLGKRIVYHGRDLNRYLDACLVEPTSGPCRRDPGETSSEAVFVEGGEAAALASAA